MILWHNRQSSCSSKLAFTLLEVLAVVVIMGICLSLLGAKFFNNNRASLSSAQGLFASLLYQARTHACTGKVEAVRVLICNNPAEPSNYRRYGCIATKSEGSFSWKKAGKPILLPEQIHVSGNAWGEVILALSDQAAEHWLSIDFLPGAFIKDAPREIVLSSEDSSEMSQRLLLLKSSIVLPL